MKGVLAHHTIVLLVAGAAVVGSLSLAALLPQPDASDTITLWEAAARGLARVTMVNLTVHEPGGDIERPAGIRVDNLASSDLLITGYPVLMSPAFSQTPSPPAQDTTQDAVLTNGTVPAGGSLLYSYGEFVLAGWLPEGPLWWCLEEFQFTKEGIAFWVSGETLPFAFRPLIEDPFYHDPTDNTQTTLYDELRSHPAVVVSKEPLWTTLDSTAGQRLRVRIDAANLAIWLADAAGTADVNVTDGAIEDIVPAGWTVEEGSFSTPPDSKTTNPDGSVTYTWLEDLPAATVPSESNPAYPTAYLNVTQFYTLVTPALDVPEVELPRATSTIDRGDTPDAESAPVLLTVLGVTPPPTAPELARADIRLRIAGEKGHDVTLIVRGNGTELAILQLVRSPGNPNAVRAATGVLTFNLSSPVELLATYTPGDDPVNGRPNGDNPAWITVAFPDGKSIEFFHNFNVVHASTWSWESGDLRSRIRDLHENFTAAATTRAAEVGIPSPSALAELVASVATAAVRPVESFVRLLWQRVI